MFPVLVILLIFILTDFICAHHLQPSCNALCLQSWLAEAALRNVQHLQWVWQQGGAKTIVACAQLCLPRVYTCKTKATAVKALGHRSCSLQQHAAQQGMCC